MIPGFFQRNRYPQPFVRIALVVEEFGTGAAVVPFLVDTGAARTTVHALDSLRFFSRSPSDLDSNLWSQRTTMGGVGGSVHYKPSPAIFGFAHDHGGIQTVEQEILIGDLSSAGIPSLLGWDLLRHFELRVSGRDLTVSLTPV